MVPTGTPLMANGVIPFDGTWVVKENSATTLLFPIRSHLCGCRQIMPGTCALLVTDES
jgi:hypothetical protein